MEPLRASELKRSFGGNEVLKGVSLNIRPGEIVAILGQNGAGKTTTIRIFSTLLKYDSGELSLFGEDPFRSKNIDLLRRRIGYVGQDSERSAYGRLTAEENLLFFGRLLGMRKSEIKRKISLLSASFHFDEKLGEQFMKLSGGQKQTLVIMRALLHDPELIFLDEPTKGLDPVRAREIRSFLKKYVKENGKTLLLTSHILPDVEYLADRVAFMKSGKIEYVDTPENVCSILGYSDIIEVDGGEAGEEIGEYVSSHPDMRLLSRTEGNFVLGTNSFFKDLEGICKISDRIGFSHRKANLEDAYLHFTQAKL
jgi:ABC-2 type transport system ATP-binding protein